jgi:hypothetical protein
MPDGSFFTSHNLDHEQLDPFLARLIAVAGDRSGLFVAFGVGETPGAYERLSPQTYAVENGPNAQAELLAAIEQINTVPGLNAYISIGLFKPRDQWVNPNGRGKEVDLIGSLAFVADLDSKGGEDQNAAIDRLPVTPHYVVETSAGSLQAWFFLDRPYPVAEAKPVFEAITKALGGDDTFSCEHVFRPPGTWNWPTKKKVTKYRRSPQPQLARLVEAVLW